jgi:SAM-dependent methyltransferase
MGFISWFHERYIFQRRVRRLASALDSMIPVNARVLDIGAGDGALDKLLLQRRPDISITGLDVLVRSQAAIPVEHFDGSHIPFPDQSWDVVMFVDVLHHTGQTLCLLKEAARVGRAIVIKDHLDEGVASHQTLRLMDYVGNARHGVALPYDYWPRSKWQSAFRELGLAPVLWNERIGLYPVPLTFWFDRSLHFVTRLEVSHSEDT